MLDVASTPAACERTATGPIVVEARRSIEAIADVRADMERLVLASSRRCPFSTPAYLARVVAEDEFLRLDGTDARVLVLLAYAGGELVGYLPLRERETRALFTTSVRVELLVTHDNERPDVVAAPGPMEMGGMFTVVKVREGIASYDDPGWYRHPDGTVARRVG